MKFHNTSSIRKKGRQTIHQIWINDYNNQPSSCVDECAKLFSFFCWKCGNKSLAKSKERKTSAERNVCANVFRWDDKLFPFETTPPYRTERWMTNCEQMWANTMMMMIGFFFHFLPFLLMLAQEFLFRMTNHRVSKSIRSIYFAYDISTN